MKTPQEKTQTQIAKFWKWILLLSPVFVSLIVILPRLLSPQFGLFDDPTTIMTSRSIEDGFWGPTNESVTGRFRPFYWIYNYLIYLIVDTRPFGFFAGNAILFLGSTLFITLYTKRSGGSDNQAWFAGLLFALAGPTIENYYTLSKPESIQVFWITLALLLSVRFQNARRGSSLIKLFVLVILPMFIAFCTKETSLVMLPISFVWFVWGYVHKRLRPDYEGGNYRTRKFFFCAVLISATVYLIWRFTSLPFWFTEQGYSSRYVFNLERIISSSRVWLDWLVRNFLYLLPLIIFVLVVALRRQKLPNSFFLVDMLVWVTAWIGIYLPWNFQAGYYLLPFAIGSSILGGLLAGQILEIAFSRSSNLRILARILICIFIISLLFTIPNNITDAKHQLIVDETNTEMIETLVTQLPENSVLLINLQYTNEYVVNIEKFIKDVYGRDDITITNFQFQNLEELNNPNPFIYIISPHLYNQYYPTIRLGVFEHYMREWNPTMLEHIGDDYDIVYEIERSIQLTLVDLPRILCPPIRKMIKFCRVPNTPFDLQTLTYGWTLYRIPLAQEG